MTQVRIAHKIPPSFSLDVDFSIASGVTVLYGPSAAGKTFILESIAGFVRPRSGRILLDDVILFDGGSSVHVPARRRRCGHVAQRDSLFPHLTVRQNLIFAARLFPRLERNRRVSEMLERFGLARAAALHPHELGAAQKLRAEIARALIGEPKLLLLDDRAYDEVLLGLLRETSAASTLLVTSDLDLVCSSADELMLIEAGRILQRGAPSTVLEQPDSIDVARLVGIPNLFQATIATLDPSRDSSRLVCERFALSASYLPGHFRGDRVWIAIAPEALRVHPGTGEARDNFIAAELVRVSRRRHWVRLEFSNHIFADLSYAQFAGQQENKDWLIEFPSEAVRIL